MFVSRIENEPVIQDQQTNYLPLITTDFARATTLPLKQARVGLQELAL